MVILLVGILYPFVRMGVQKAIDGWKENKARMVAKIIMSLIFGQFLFWFLGYDQIGFFMKHIWQVGLGQNIGDWVASQVPNTPTVGWYFKVGEIIADFGKVPIEGLTYLRFGYVPDVIAGTVTQPLWSVIETAEKITGAVTNWRLVGTTEQIKVSVGCIYGSAFRYVICGGFWLIGDRLYNWVGMPIEHFVSKFI